MVIKVCTKCGEEKPATAEYFHRQKDKPEWLRSHCRDCRSRAKPKKNPQPGYKRRRSLKRNLPDSFTLKQWNFCKEHFGHSCAYCGKPSKKLHQEHFIAVKNGGGYTVSNIIPACQKCNVSKLDRDFFAWYPAQPFYSKLREKRILKYLKFEKSGLQQASLLEQIREEA